MQFFQKLGGLFKGKEKETTEQPVKAAAPAGVATAVKVDGAQIEDVVYKESGEVFYVEEFVTELTLKKFRKVFTSKRLDILNQLNKRSFDSIAEFSRSLKRDIKNVYGDLKVLEEFNLVKLEKKSKNIRPRLNVESVGIEFFSY